MKRIAILLIAASLGLAAKKKEIVWQMGRVLGQDTGSEQAGAYATPLGRGAVAVPLYASWNVVDIETAQYIYRLSETGSKRLVLPVNGQIEFYQEGDWIIMIDTKNKKHRFAIVGMRQK